mgnify:CR=1 FL=1
MTTSAGSPRPYRSRIASKTSFASTRRIQTFVPAMAAIVQGHMRFAEELRTAGKMATDPSTEFTVLEPQGKGAAEEEEKPKRAAKPAGGSKAKGKGAPPPTEVTITVQGKQ